MAVKMMSMEEIAKEYKASDKSRPEVDFSVRIRLVELMLIRNELNHEIAQAMKAVEAGNASWEMFGTVARYAMALEELLPSTPTR